VGDELRAVLRADGSLWGSISLFREQGRAGFDPAETALVASLSTPLADSLRSRARPVAAPAADAGPDGPGLLLFDPAGVLVSANDEARRWLASMPTGPCTPTPLGIRLPAWVLSTAMRARAVAAERDHGPARVRLRSHTGRWLVCHASCLRDADGELGTTALVIEPAAASEVAPILAEAYGLSARELQVTLLIARGLRTGEIAARLFLSPHTVRDHVKAIFDKVEVSSRGELVARLFAEHHAPLLHDGAIARVWDG
jgi:DNA-binding CsgD family transcriptional regulator